MTRQQSRKTLAETVQHPCASVCIRGHSPRTFVPLRLFAASCLFFSLAGTAARADEPILQFDKSFDLTKPHLVGDAKIALNQQADITTLRIDTTRWGGINGVELSPASGHWDLSKYTWIYVDVKNAGPTEAKIRCRVDNPGKEHGFIQNLLPAGIFVNGDIVLEPGQSGTIKVELRRHKPDWVPFELPGMDCKPWGQADSSDPNSPGAIDPANITDICLYVRKPVTGMSFEISAIRATGTYTAPPDLLKDPNKFFPFINEYGQYIHSDWPGKIHSPADFAKVKEDEAKDLAAHPGPANWDQYGGWKDGPQLKASGSFYVTKYNGKWTMVDPDGKLFFSNGIDCVTSGEGATLITTRENFFANLPARDSEFKDFFSAGRGRRPGAAGAAAPAAPAANTPAPAPRFTFDFGRANLYRKYGSNWPATFTELSHQRLRSWGINTMGNWSSPDIYLAPPNAQQPARRTPYTTSVGGRGKPLAAAVGWWGKFADVYDPDFATNMKAAFAAQAQTTGKDPFCIGYFVGNEQDFGGDDFELANWVLSCPADQPAKVVFLDDLKAKYGTIDKLNAAWGTSHASWDALLQNTTVPDTQKAFSDLNAFTIKFDDHYFKTIHDALKEACPNRLYLGCRFGGGYEAPPVASAAAKYCDIISANLYRESLDGYHIDAVGDKPILIGEYSFWGMDRGLFNQGGLYTEGCPTQADRARAYQRYVESALRHPQIVGCHWFKYMDEPTTGRGDGENFQFGFLDIADTPYQETVDAARILGAELYTYRASGR